MRQLGLVLVTLVTLVACRGCDDTTSQNNGTNSQPQACADLDEDGFSIGPDCEESTDCNDGDATVNPDAEEVCGDGRDNNCNDEIDEGCPVAGPCVEGATRECGQAVGRCTIGSQTCEGGEWTDCDGATAISETCNGVDDDCDGEVDENGIELCDDGLVCNGVSVCEAGACSAPEMLDCTEFDGPCTTGMCSEKDRGCKAFPIQNGTACDDGFFCTENGTCNAGACETTPRDCSGVEDACNIGVCDEGTDSCVQQPKSDGIVCDDTLFCTTGDTCTAGVCGGAARDCASAADQCNTGVCDDTADACVPAPIANGTACDDGAYCNTGETCQAGACTGGAARDCSASGGSCRSGTCNETTDSCDGPPVADGTPCDDSQFCTTADACVAGTCMGGTPRDCSGVNGVCRVGMCNEAVNQCVPAPAPNGATCDDGQFCTVNDTCTSGACGGTSRNCATAGGECTVGSCDEAADACVGQPTSDGSPCPDSLFCTQNEVCMGGACTRQPRNCSSVGDVCNDGVCDDSADACVALAKANGTACTDGLFCTSADSCQAGVCTGGPTSCSQFDDVCTVGTCDEMANTCTGAARPDNTSCDDGLFCTIMDSCSGGVCTGAQRNCSGMSDQCNLGVCNDTTDACAKQPLANGTVCNDGDFCTVPDACTAGVCGGPARDCSIVADQCNTGVCTQSGCVAQPRANGTSCTLADFCVENTQCTSGVCEGDPKTCPDMPPCQDGVCDSSQSSCMLVDNGTCNTCATSTPTANAGPNQAAVPNQTVQLNGTGSSDPTGQMLTYAWRVAVRPTGSTAQLSNAAFPSPTLLADVAGTFTVCLTVTDSPDACVSAEDCMDIIVAPIADILIELVWFNGASDMDLHYQAPNYLASRWFGATGVTWFNYPNPDWGGGATGDSPDGISANNPSLDVDNRTGFGPENINHNNVFDGTPFTIGVHYYSNTDTTLEPFTGPTDARIRVYRAGNPNPIFERTRQLKCQDFWEVGEITVSGNGTVVSVAPKNTLTTRDPSTAPTCRCNSDSDCPGSDTCKPYRLAGGGPPRYVDLCAP